MKRSVEKEVKLRLLTRKKAFTLAETLVVMVISGIVLISVLDGFTLFEKFRCRISGDIVSSAGAMQDYFRLERLFQSSDSITGDMGRMDFFRGGRAQAAIIIDGSLLVLTTDGRKDTLTRDLTASRIIYNEKYPGRADSLVLEYDTVSVVFGIRRSPENEAVEEVEAIEKKYGANENE